MEIYKFSAVIKAGSIVVPFMLAQELGVMSESKACELLGCNIEEYREHKYKIVEAVQKLLEDMPCDIMFILNRHTCEQSKEVASNEEPKTGCLE